MKKRERAELVIHQKLTMRSGLIRELSVWRVKKSDRYPEGYRYRLVLVDPAMDQVHLLHDNHWDNHWPKGHHVHRGDIESRYQFTTLPNLLGEFWAESERINRSL